MGGKEGKDKTIAKVTGTVIACGIAHSLYRSFVGNKPDGSLVSEPSGEGILGVDAPEVVSGVEGDAKEAAGGVEHKVGEIAAAVEDKASGVGETIELKAQEAEDKGKASLEEAKARASSKGTKEKNIIASWFEVFVESIFAQLNKDKPAPAKPEKEGVVENGGRPKTEKGVPVNAEPVVVVPKVVVGGKSKPADSAWAKTGGAKAGSKKEYVVAWGDTLWSISKRYGASVEELKTLNHIPNVDFIMAGDTLLVPK